MSSTTERWAFVRDSKIILHTENDGWAFRRHGPEAREREISLGELAACYPSILEALIKTEKARYLRAQIRV
jgi:hypothetical protein